MNFARMIIAAPILGTLTLGCGLTQSGPVVDRIEQIAIAPGRISLLPYQSVDLTLVVTTSHGNPADLASLQWSTTGGTVVNSGIFAGVQHMTYSAPAAPGDYKIIVISVTGTPADTASIAVTATAVPVNAVSVSPGSVSLALGDTTKLRATLTDESGAVLVGREIEWSTSDAGVATVLATGLVRAIAGGSATIPAKTEGHSGTAMVTVAQ
jgi:hypothetical protein